jgi:hypothetical protein
MQIDLTNLQNQMKDIDSAILQFHKLEKFNNQFKDVNPFPNIDKFERAQKRLISELVQQASP